MAERKPERADESLVVVEGVDVSFGPKRVLEGVSLTVRRGETVALLAESGGGKTVLLKVILGLVRPQAGRVRVFGTDVHARRRRALSDAGLDAIRRRISVVYQGGALYSGMTVAENVALELTEVLRLPKAEVARRVRESLEAVGLGEVNPDLVPDELSGGMRKRLAVARAIAPHPEMIFYDEPTSGLDPINSARILSLIRALHGTYGVTSVVVTHDVRGAMAIADRMVLLARGKVAFDGPPDAFAASRDPDVVAFRAAAPGFAPEPGPAGQAEGARSRRFP